MPFKIVGILMIPKIAIVGICSFNYKTEFTHITIVKERSCNEQKINKILRDILSEGKPLYDTYQTSINGKDEEQFIDIQDFEVD